MPSKRRQSLSKVTVSARLARPTRSPPVRPGWSGSGCSGTDASGAAITSSGASASLGRRAGGRRNQRRVLDAVGERKHGRADVVCKRPATGSTVDDANKRAACRRSRYGDL